MGEQRQEAVILLICDSPEPCHAAAPLLEKAGYRVVEASAEEAHAQALAHRADLILLDLSAPETALAVAQQLKADPTTEAIPLLHLTASEHEALPITQGLEAGADASLTKPVPEEALLSMVRGLVRMGRACREARRDRDRLAEVLRQMPSGFILADGEGELLLTNERAREILRIPEIPQTDAERIRVMEPSFEGVFQGLEGWPLWRAINHGERTTGVEFELARAEGERVAVRVSAGPVRDPSGEVIAGALTFTDISDLKQAEESLRESEARFRALVTASSDVKLRVDVEVARENGSLRLCVWNSGNPISGDFDPVSAPGMGLQLVRDLVTTQYRGGFSLRPRGGGTVAEMVVPLAQVQGEQT